jgi:hypothetical protein
MLSFSISYPYLIKFQCFADNSQEGVKDQVRGATQVQESMTLWITLLYESFCLCKKVHYNDDAQLFTYNNDLPYPLNSQCHLNDLE